MNKRWLIKEKPNEQEVQDLATSLGVEPVLASLLIQRNIRNYDEAALFFRPSLNQLHDPFLMKNMDLAVARLCRAKEEHQKVLLFGDYDVDGTSAVALLWNVLKDDFEGLDYYIPDRYAEGYGISFQGIDYAQECGVKLIIALDCGIRSEDKALYAKERGIDLLICDHHEPGQSLPKAIVLDPKQAGCKYPYKELSGCGVGFKLLQAFYAESGRDQELLFRQLDLLALSIAADLVPITGENRILCRFGLELINRNPRAGIRQLLIQAKKQVPLTLTQLVFVLAPRINAAGRIHHGKKAVQLLTSDEQDELRQLAESIESDNLERRKLDQEITAQALRQVEEDPGFSSRRSTVVFDPAWHKGVIGIVASRLIEQHYRPTVVLTESNGKLTGSARSISGFDLHRALENCSDCLEQFGGHAFAAGMTLFPEQLPLFRERFEQVVQKGLPIAESVAQQIIDAELMFSDLFLPGENVYSIPKFKRILNQLEPHGPGNMKPVFISRHVYVEDVRVLKDSHLKLVLSQAGSAIELQAIGFDLVHHLDLVLSKASLDILYTLETNSWNQNESLQLNIKDIRATV